MAGNNIAHFKVKPFDGTGNFTLWQSRVKDILIQQGLAKPLKGKEDGKPEKMTDDDWNKKGKVVEKGYGKNSRSISNDNMMGDVLTVSKDIHASTQDKWILDSGCSMHVCFRKGYFDKIQMKKAAVLTLGDGSTCNVEGIGTVKIKMFNGAVYTLGGVAYVPKMCKNLVSLIQLDSQGYGYSARGGVLKITRGYKVLMKGEKYDSLYRLVGSTKCTRISKVWKVCTRETDQQNFMKCLTDVDDGEKENPTMGEVIRDPSPKSTM